MKGFACTKAFLGMAFLCLAFAFSACGDDDSSVAPRDEDSSSSVCEDCDDSSSSKKISSSSKEKTSSSRNDDLEESSSSSAKSSSSRNKSSSSKKVSSSSKGKASSSSNPDNDKSSSSAKSSSSSVTQQSSSSEYVPFDHSQTLAGAYKVGENAYKQFTDMRNGRSYYYITIMSDYTGKSVTVMAENLNIGKMVPGAENQNDDNEIERYCYNNDTTKCDEFGGLYQWAEMMQLPSRCNTESCADLIQPNHQGICPDGWRLLTQDDFYIVINADGNTHGVAGIRSTYGFNGFNSTGYSLVGAGYVWDRKFKALNSSTYWYYPEEAEGTDAVDCAPATGVSNTATGTSTFIQYKHHGFSVRCVKVE